MTTWTVLPNGHVESVRIMHSTLKDALVERCITQQIAGWSFPASPKARTVAYAVAFPGYRTEDTPSDLDPDLLDGEAVRAVIAEHAPEVKACFTDGVRRKPALAGTVVVAITLVPSGAVSAAKVKRSTLGDARVDACIVQRTKHWAFPRAKAKRALTFSYPFSLRAVAPQ